MNLLITPGEVAVLAFRSCGECEPDYISESVIASAQQKFLRPVLNGLYDEVAAGRHADLVEGYLKPALAQYVKLLLIPMLAVNVGPNGIIRSKGPNFSGADDTALAALTRRVHSDANALMRVAMERIESDSASYPSYDPARNVLNRTSIASGVIL